MASNNQSDCEIFTNIQIAKNFTNRAIFMKRLHLFTLKRKKKGKKYRPPSQSLFDLYDLRLHLITSLIIVLIV